MLGCVCIRNSHVSACVGVFCHRFDCRHSCCEDQVRADISNGRLMARMKMGSGRLVGRLLPLDAPCGPQLGSAGAIMMSWTVDYVKVHGAYSYSETGQVPKEAPKLGGFSVSWRHSVELFNSSEIPRLHPTAAPLTPTPLINPLANSPSLLVILRRLR